MATNSTVKKGFCINVGNCNNANEKKVIEINIGEDFECPDCHGMLVEVKSKKTLTPIIAAVAAVVLLGGGGAAYFLTKPQAEEVVVVEQPKEEPVVEEKAKPAAATGKSFEASAEGVDWTYEGKRSDNKPHGNGTMTFVTSVVIDDLKGRVASPGDYVTGIFKNGKIQNVKWYKKNDEFIATVIP